MVSTGASDGACGCPARDSAALRMMPVGRHAADDAGLSTFKQKFKNTCLNPAVQTVAASCMHAHSSAASSTHPTACLPGSRLHHHTHRHLGACSTAVALPTATAHTRTTAEQQQPVLACVPSIVLALLGGVGCWLAWSMQARQPPECGVSIRAPLPPRLSPPSLQKQQLQGLCPVAWVLTLRGVQQDVVPEWRVLACLGFVPPAPGGPA
jgi:hypothetical protein